MNLLFALVVAVLFGTGAYLLLNRELFRVVVGLVLISNAATLTIIASGLIRGQAPILPLTGGEPISDPLTQAMTLTAIVIGIAITALLLAMVPRVHDPPKRRPGRAVAQRAQRRGGAGTRPGGRAGGDPSAVSLPSRP